MAKRKRRTEKTVYERDQKIEDTQRISNNLNRRTKKDKGKNPFLKENGGFDLIDEVINYGH